MGGGGLHSKRSHLSYRPAPRSIPSRAALFRGSLLQVRDQVAAVLRLGHAEAHALAGHELLGIGEPAVERLFVPHLMRGLQGIGISEAGRLRRRATEDAAVSGAHAVVV